MNTTITVITPASSSFYDHLLEWELLADLIEQFMEEERAAAQAEMMEAIDHAIHQTILEQLAAEHHAEYLELCQIKHHEPTLLDWIQERTTHPDLPALIQETYITVYAQLKVELQVSIQTESSRDQ